MRAVNGSQKKEVRDRLFACGNISEARNRAPQSWVPKRHQVSEKCKRQYWTKTQGRLNSGEFPEVGDQFSILSKKKLTPIISN